METQAIVAKREGVLHVLSYHPEGPKWVRWTADQKPQVTVSGGTLSILWNDPEWPGGWGMTVFPLRNVLRWEADASVPVDWPAAPR